MNVIVLEGEEPLDDPKIFNFAVSAIKELWGEETRIDKSEFYEDYFLGYDLTIRKQNDNKDVTAQVKTNKWKTIAREDLHVHITYIDGRGKESGLEKYIKRPFNYFIFIWPYSGCALFIQFDPMMELWKRKIGSWKVYKSRCKNGCYVSIPLLEFTSLLREKDYRLIEVPKVE